MPLLRTETLFGIVCHVYDGGVVKVGTNADRWTLRLKANEELVPRLRAALVKRGLGSAEELPEDVDAAAAIPMQPPPHSAAEPSQLAADEPSILFGQLRRTPAAVPSVSAQDREALRSVRRLESDLGKAWDIGQPAHRAEDELRQISKVNGQIYMNKIAAMNATTKRKREEREAQREPCLCTRDGAAALLRESQQQTREALSLVQQNINVLARMKNAARMPAGP